MSNKHTAENITQDAANEIARAAIDGDRRYYWEPIGAEDCDINNMAEETGGRRIIRAANDSEVAVYARPSGELVIVADANGPVAITIL